MLVVSFSSDLIESQRYAEKAPGSTLINPKQLSKDLSTYPIVYLFYIPTNS